MHVDKPSGTTAAITQFCAAKVEGPDGEHLWVDGNGKITAGNGTLDAPKPNAFSILQVSDCPWATDTCKTTCYVHMLEKHAPETHALYRHNSATIRRILATDQHPTWARVFGDYVSDNCRGGFRWHVSGDVFSPDYARWIAAVCRRSREVKHWIYTRSFPLVEPLVVVPNLVVNLSCDRNNYERAAMTALKYNLRLCYLTVEGEVPPRLSAADVIFPDYALRGGTEAGAAWFEGLPPHYKKMVCPVDYHGKAENRRCGPCNRCMI